VIVHSFTGKENAMFTVPLVVTGALAVFAAYEVFAFDLLKRKNKPTR
jgi:hypothetical protein